MSHRIASLVRQSVGNMKQRCTESYTKGCFGATELACRHSSLVLFGIGAVLLTVGLNELVMAQSGDPKQACGRLLQYLETGFGALVATAAGVGAIVASAVGGFKAAWCLLVVSVGAFILRAYIPLFNGACT